jgi:hypothetical protein
MKYLSHLRNVNEFKEPILTVYLPVNEKLKAYKKAVES